MEIVGAPTCTDIHDAARNWPGTTDENLKKSRPFLAMDYRPLGTTGIRVSVIGMGTWAIGGRTPGNTSYGATDDAVSHAAIREALARGINFFDTANVYGNGHSEELLGACLGTARNQVVIATKCGMLDLHGTKDFSPESIMRSVEGSLRRLRTDRLDLLQLHDPPISLAQDDRALAALDGLVASGKVLMLGTSVKTPSDGLHFLDSRWGSIQCNFNLIDIRAVGCGLLEKATAAGIGVIARTPFAFGFLTDRFGGVAPIFADGDHRRRWPARQIELWLEAASYFLPFALACERSITQLALGFCKDVPGLTSTIPGITTAKEATENAYVADLPSLTSETIDALLDASRQKTFFLAEEK